MIVSEHVWSHNGFGFLNLKSMQVLMKDMGFSFVFKSDSIVYSSFLMRLWLVFMLINTQKKLFVIVSERLRYRIETVFRPSGDHLSLKKHIDVVLKNLEFIFCKRAG